MLSDVWMFMDFHFISLFFFFFFILCVLYSFAAAALLLLWWLLLLLLLAAVAGHCWPLWVLFVAVLGIMVVYSGLNKNVTCFRQYGF